MEKDELVLGGKVFTNRLFTGTGKFARNEDIAPMLEASGSQMVTVALRRIDFKFPQENILNFIPKNVTLLPNTSGARNCAEAVKIARMVKEGELDADRITEDLISDSLDTAGIPDPDLLIRTCNEERISNFLLWQLAYTEFYFTPVAWPDFSKAELEKAVEAYNHRDRKYGLVKEE